MVTKPSWSVPRAWPTCHSAIPEDGDQTDVDVQIPALLRSICGSRVNVSIPVNSGSFIPDTGSEKTHQPFPFFLHPSGSGGT